MPKTIYLLLIGISETGKLIEPNVSVQIQRKLALNNAVDKRILKKNSYESVLLERIDNATCPVTPGNTLLVTEDKLTQ